MNTSAANPPWGPILAGLVAILVAIGGWLVGEILEGQRELERVQRDHRQKLYEQLGETREKQIHLERRVFGSININKENVISVQAKIDAINETVIEVRAMQNFQREIIAKFMANQCIPEKDLKNGQSRQIPRPGGVATATEQ